MKKKLLLIAFALLNFQACHCSLKMKEPAKPKVGRLLKLQKTIDALTKINNELAVTFEDLEELRLKIKNEDESKTERDALYQHNRTETILGQLKEINTQLRRNKQKKQKLLEEHRKIKAAIKYFTIVKKITRKRKINTI